MYHVFQCFFTFLAAIRAAFDEKALFPSYILDFERNMKNYHSMMLTGAQVGVSRVEVESLRNRGTCLDT